MPEALNKQFRKRPFFPNWPKATRCCRQLPQSTVGPPIYASPFLSLNSISKPLRPPPPVKCAVSTGVASFSYLLASRLPRNYCGTLAQSIQSVFWVCGFCYIEFLWNYAIAQQCLCLVVFWISSGVTLSMPVPSPIIPYSNLSPILPPSFTPPQPQSLIRSAIASF